MRVTLEIRVDAERPIMEDGDSLVVDVNDPANFVHIDADPVVIDQARGISAVLGETRAGHRDVLRLRFQKASWDHALVRSFLAKNGFDHAHDEDQVAVASEKRVVQEDKDWWVIPDTVLTREGVMNHGLKPWDELVKTARMWENIPIVYPHPEGLVGPNDLPMVGGFVRNVRLDTQGRRILGDAHLARHSLPDFEVSAAALRLNEETVRRFKAGDAIDNSVGFQYHREPQKGKHGEREYDHVQRNLKPDHLAILGAGKNREKGACGWGYGCGLGRGQEVRLERFLAVNNHGPPIGGQRPPMPCDASKAAEHEQLDSKVKDLEKQLGAQRDHVAAVAKTLGLPVGADCAGIETAVKARLERLASLETAAKARHDQLALETAKLETGGDYEKDAQAKTETDELAKKFSSWPTDALEHHKASLMMLLATDTPTGSDASLAGGRRGADSKAGFATIAKVWPKKKEGDA